MSVKRTDFRFLQIANNLVIGIENKKINAFELLITIASVAFVRSFLEIFSNAGAILHPSVFLVQFPLWYATVFLGLSIVISISLGRDIVKVLKLVIAFAFITFIPPIVDLLFFRRGGINYIFSLKDISKPLSEPFKVYITFFFNLKCLPPGVSPGIMVEAYMIVLLIFFYGIAVNAGLIRSIVASFLSYSLIYFFAIIPYVIGKIEIFLKVHKLISPYSVLNSDQGCFLFLILFVLLMFIKAKGRIALSCFLSSRFFRLLHYIFVFLFGLYIGIGKNWRNFASLNYGKLLLTFLVVVLSEIGAVFLNDIYDFKSDKINKRNSPFVRGLISRDELFLMAYLSFFLALLGGLLVNYPVLYWGFVMISLASLYSLPPFRLKRFLGISTLVLGAISVVVALLAFMFTGEYFSHNVLDFPSSYIGGLFIFVWLAGNIKDLGDEKGDKIDNIFTLPVLFGEKSARLGLAFVVLVLFCVVPFVLKLSLLYLFLAVAFGLLSFIFLIKRLVVEFVFALYYVYFLIILFAGAIR